MLKMSKIVATLFAYCSVFISYPPHTPTKAVEFSRPYIHITSPLYEAWLDVEYHMLTQLTCTVTKKDCVAGDEPAVRNWWTPREIGPYCLEDADYVGSGYQRGHVRALRWSAGSDNWPDVNMLGVIVPQLPEVNNGPIKSLEAYVYGVAVDDKEDVKVQFWCLFDVDKALTSADEPNRIPSHFHYLITIDGKDQEFLIPNQADVSPDYQKYAVKPEK